MVGRPKDPEKESLRKQKLLQAARELLLEKSYRSITIREIAARAGVQSAMISYDFGSKEGLFVCLMQQHQEEVRERLGSLSIGSDSTLESLIGDFYGALLPMIVDNPWLPRLAADEVLQQDSDFSKKVASQLLIPMAQAVIGLIEKLQSAGKVRADFPANLVALNIISLAAFPVLTFPVSEQTWGFDMEIVGKETWKQQLVSIVTQGLTGESINGH